MVVCLQKHHPPFSLIERSIARWSSDQFGCRKMEQMEVLVSDPLLRKSLLPAKLIFHYFLVFINGIQVLTSIFFFLNIELGFNSTIDTYLR